MPGEGQSILGMNFSFDLCVGLFHCVCCLFVLFCLNYLLE